MSSSVAFIFSLVMSVPLSFLRAWVYVLLWDWFVVTTFSVQHILMWQAFGLAVLLGLVSHQQESISDAVIEMDDAIRLKMVCHRIASSLVYSIFALFWGWVVFAIWGSK